MKKISFLLVICSALFTLPAWAQAGPGFGPGPHGPGGFGGPGGPGGGFGVGPGRLGRGAMMGHDHDFEATAKLVGLKDKQLEEIRKISFTSRREEIDIERKIQLARLDLHQLMTGTKPPDEAQALALVDKLSAAELEMKRNHVLRLIRIRKVMTPAQWKKMEELFAQRHGRSGWGKGAGKGWGKGGKAGSLK